MPPLEVAYFRALLIELVKKMILKGFGTCVLLLGLAMSIVAAMAYWELNAAATSERAPSADSMPLTKILNPALFAPGDPGAKPAELARTAFNRIYAIAGGGIVAAILGVLTFAVPKSQRQPNSES